MPNLFLLPGQKAIPVPKLAIAALCLSATLASATSIFEDIGTWLQGKTEAVKATQANRPEELNKLIAGHWSDKVQIVVSDPNTKKGEPDRHAYTWIGNITGSVDNTGKMMFLMENGCRFQGEVLTFASDDTWSVEGFLEFCPVKSLNRKVIGRLVNKNKRIFFSVYQTVITPDPQVKIQIRTTLLSRV